MAQLKLRPNLNLEEVANVTNVSEGYCYIIHIVGKMVSNIIPYFQIQFKIIWVPKIKLKFAYRYKLYDNIPKLSVKPSLSVSNHH